MAEELRMEVPLRVLVGSDTHGRLAGLEKALSKVRPDLLLHLGDVDPQAEQVRKLAEGTVSLSGKKGIPCRIVRGNCDYSAGLPAEELIRIGRKSILIMHGHRYQVGYDLSYLERHALEVGADLALYGHTHVPQVCRMESGVVIACPGSLSLPRQENRKPSYLLLDFDRAGEFHLNINYL